MLLLFDIGNTHTHVGLADHRRVLRHRDFPTRAWREGLAITLLRRFVRRTAITGVALCSVVPLATPVVSRTCRRLWRHDPLVLSPATLVGVGIDYPKPGTIGP